MSLNMAPFDAIDVVEDGDTAQCSINGRPVITARRNAFGFWVIKLPIGTRYYSNPLACAHDLIVAKHITREEADRVIGPSIPRHRVRVRNGREYHEYY